MQRNFRAHGEFINYRKIAIHRAQTSTTLTVRKVRFQKMASCCCDECCELVEKFRNRRPVVFFRRWCAVDFLARVRKSQRVLPCGVVGPNSSTNRPRLSHVFLTHSPHKARTVFVFSLRRGNTQRVSEGRLRQRTEIRCRLAKPGIVKEKIYCRASIRRVMVRFSSLSERRSSSILLIECSTVV